MTDVPYPITSPNWEEGKSQVYDLIRQLFEEKVAGAEVGDIFSITSGVLTAVLADSSGLTKSGGALAVEVSSTGGLTVGSSGVAVQALSTGGLTVAAGGVSIKLDGTSLSVGSSGLKVGQSAHITDASTSHSVASWADTIAALNALGVKINAILALLEARGLMATS